MATYTKPYQTPAGLVRHLRARGLSIPNQGKAENFIKEIGFDRLRIYFLSRRDFDAPGRPFRAGTTFDNIIDIYAFDENLRLLMFKYSSKVEIILKTAISEEICKTHGCTPYMIGSLYKDRTSRSAVIKSISALSHRYAVHDRRAQHYFKKYDDPAFPPLWTMREFMTFGSLNFFYQKLDTNLKKVISTGFGFKRDNILPMWINCFVDLRNVCAHHDRLFNRKFQKKPAKSIFHGVPSARDNTKVAALCGMMQVIVNSQGANYNIEAEVHNLLAMHASVSPFELGF